MNSTIFKTFLFGCGVAVAPCVHAALIYNFSSPTGTLGTSQNYTNNSVTITAYGFTNGGSGMDLFGKAGGGDENGLGLNGTSDDEIGTTNFVQLNLTNVLATNPKSILMSIGSVQSGEGWNIYVSNTLGSRGTLLQSGTTDAPTTFTLDAIPAGDHYLSVQATSGNVLLSTLSTTNAPEPGSAALLGVGLLGFGMLLKRVRRGQN